MLEVKKISNTSPSDVKKKKDLHETKVCLKGLYSPTNWTEHQKQKNTIY